MGQVNVNTPGGADGEPAGSSGAGFILGIIIAIILIAVLVYMFVLNPGTNGGGNTTDPPVEEPPSSWVLTDHA
jgi:peptidoglycan/LPS O-acetylase OafA/YrhL